MKKSFKASYLALLGLSLMTLLSACGLVKAFIPDQSLENPLGIGGQELELSLDSNSESITVQASDNVFVGTLNTSFTNQDVDIPSGLEPGAYSEDIGMASSFTLSSVATDLPDQLVLNSASLELGVADESKNISESFVSAADLNITFTRGNCTLAGTTNTCTYTTDTADISLLGVSISGRNFDTLFGIITEGTASNTASVGLTLSFETDNDLPADSQLVIQTETANGTLTF